ncbi:MAG: hypothetical protein HC890_11775 [Chloroflexaceae bacterium]|nr:hypothetical protein [Chloroflexaceae bacterium]
MAILQAESDRLSLEKQQDLGQLQQELRDKEQKIQKFEQFITAHRSKLIDPQEVERDLKTKLGETLWLGLTKATQKEFCNAFRHYCSIKSEEFTASLSDYSTAGTPLGCGVEREVVGTYFKAIRQFYGQNLDKYGTWLNGRTEYVNCRCEAQVYLGRFAPAPLPGMDILSARSPWKHPINPPPMTFIARSPDTATLAIAIGTFCKLF